MGFPGFRSILSFLVLGAAVGLTSCTSVPPAVPGPVLAEEYYNLGNAWFELKKYDKAAVAYQKAVAWNPELKVAALNLARTKAETGDPAGALALLAPLEAANPENLVVAQYRAWLTAKVSGPAAAADLYAALAAKIPGDGPTQFNAGLCLRAADRLDEALKALRAWKSLDGKSEAGLTALAEVLDLTNDPEAASVWLEVAGTFPEGDAKRFGPLVSRAKALEAGQAYGDAVQAWEAALAVPEASGQNRAEAQFRRGSLLILRIEDFPTGSEGVLEAWKAGYKDKDAWKALRESPDLKFATQLEATLKLAGVEP